MESIRLIISLGVVSVLTACGPNWDTEVEGFVVVSTLMPANIETVGVMPTYVSLVNGDERVRLFYDEKTLFVNTREGNKITLDFDRVYRVRGRKDWEDPGYVTEGGGRERLVLPDTTMNLWALRIERLSESESQSLIDSGAVTPRQHSSASIGDPTPPSYSSDDLASLEVALMEARARAGADLALRDGRISEDEYESYYQMRLERMRSSKKP